VDDRRLAARTPDALTPSDVPTSGSAAAYAAARRCEVSRSVRDRDEVPTRADFPVLRPQTTRWSDDDRYGHVNNVVHYSWFDTAVNGELIARLGRDVRDLPAIGLVVETACRYLAPLRFPDRLEVGIAVERLGASSITYELAVFAEGENRPASVGRFVHVYVDRDDQTRSVPIPGEVRAAVASLQRDPTTVAGRR
jgi:acyl-CoA thioester hydrolase